MLLPGPFVLERAGPDSHLRLRSYAGVRVAQYPPGTEAVLSCYQQYKLGHVDVNGRVASTRARRQRVAPPSANPRPIL
eukprot:3500223-Rhodomonas_salina.1